MTNDKRILVVEDDADCRTALCVILESLGFDPVSFGTAREALEKVKDESFAIALLDIMMTEMNGYELLEELKKFPQFEDTPFIMVTAKDEDSEILEGYKSGADYYITKPFTSKQIEYGLKLFLNPGETAE
jgi:DNA-binding response OmpR family regulator